MKDIRILFISKKCKTNFENLRNKIEMDIATKKLKNDPTSGIKIQKRIWPKEYKKLKISNLWKLNLKDGWRLIYTIETDQDSVAIIIIECFNHKEYCKRFKYKVS